MKSRPPTPGDLKKYRGLFVAAGGSKREFLRRLARALKVKPRRGPKPREYPPSMPREVMYLGLLKGISRTEAIREWVMNKGAHGRGTKKSDIANVTKAFRKAVVVKRYPRPAFVTDLFRARNKSRDGL